MALDAPIINLKGVLHSGITEFVIPSCDLFLIDLGVAARVGTTGVAPGIKNTTVTVLKSGITHFSAKLPCVKIFTNARKPLGYNFASAEIITKITTQLLEQFVLPYSRVKSWRQEQLSPSQGKGASGTIYWVHEEQSPTNPSFEPRPSYQHKTTFFFCPHSYWFYLKRWFFQCYFKNSHPNGSTSGGLSASVAALGICNSARSAWRAASEYANSNWNNELEVSCSN